MSTCNMSQARPVMKSFTRKSISEDFEFHCCDPVPDIPQGGARVKVYYAGACYTDHQVVRSGQRRPRIQGVYDTSLFPGFEVSGIVDEICPSVASRPDCCQLSVGDRVVVYPTPEVEQKEDGYAEYVVVKDAAHLVRVPDCLGLDVASMLPCGGLMAYSAVERARPYVAEKLQTSDDLINILIVGAGGLSLWTLKFAEYYIGDHSSRVRIVVADPSIEKLHLAKDEGCYDVIEWRDDLHEEYINMRIRNVCHGGVDVVIDFVSSTRTTNRALSVLKENGVLIVGGNSKYEVPINFHSLAMRNQSVLGVHRGTCQQLREIVDLVASEKIRPPMFKTFPVDQANHVFQKLSQSKLNGRAVFRMINNDGTGEDSVFFRNGNGSTDGFSFNSENGYCSSPDCTSSRGPQLMSQFSIPERSSISSPPMFTL